MAKQCLYHDSFDSPISNLRGSAVYRVRRSLLRGPFVVEVFSLGSGGCGSSTGPEFATKPTPDSVSQLVL